MYSWYNYVKLGKGLGAGMKRREKVNGYQPLSKTQTQVLRLILEGYMCREVGVLLGMAKRTVETHVCVIYKKWEVHNRVNLTKRAFELGFIPSPKQGAA